MIDFQKVRDCPLKQCFLFIVQNSFPNLGRFQEEPLLMEAFGPCLPNNRAGGEFIRLDVVKLIYAYPLSRNDLQN